MRSSEDERGVLVRRLRARVEARLDLRLSPDGQHLAAASQDPPVRFLPYALAGDGRELTFYEANWPPASSIYPPNDDFLRPFHFASEVMAVKGRRRIEAVSLDQACRTENVWPDYLKLDVEGAELQVLEGGGQAMKSTLMLDLEVEFAPIRADQPLFRGGRHPPSRAWLVAPRDPAHPLADETQGSTRGARATEGSSRRPTRSISTRHWSRPGYPRGWR